MRKTLKLSLPLDSEDAIEGIGISTGLSDYRLAWTLNNAFQWQLQFSEETLQIPVKKSKNLSTFHFHKFISDEEKVSVFLIKNKQEGKAFFEDYPQFDYVMFFKDNFSINLEQLTSSLRELDPIIAAFRCTSTDFSNSKFLIFEPSHE